MTGLSYYTIVLLYFVSIGLNAGLLYWVYANDFGTIGRVFSFSVVMMMGWVMSSSVTIISSHPSFIFAFWHVTYIFVWGTAVGWFFFALYYTGREEQITIPRLAGVGVLMTVLLSATLTNPRHNFLWESYSYQTEPFTYLTAEPSILFFVHLAVGYTFTLGTAVLLLVTMVRSERITRQQTLLLGSAFVVATIVHAADALQILEAYNYDVFVVTILGLAMAYTLLRKDLLALEPISRTDVMASVQEGIIVISDDRKVVDYNSKAQEIFPDVSDSFGESIDGIAPQLIDDAGKDGPEQFASEFEIQNEGKDAEKYVIESDPVFKYGSRRGYTLTLRDVTEIEQYARNLERQTEQLEEFTSFVSHDLRNPLTVAETYMYDFNKEVEDERIDITMDALDRMDEMIDESLTLAREGQAIQEKKQASLHAIADDAWNTSDTRDATFENNVNKNTIIYADDSRVQTLFENLFRNTVDHGPSDVTVRIGELEGGFYVEDDGPGIPQSKQDKVFKKGMTTNQDGAGLGLAIVDSIAKAHEWEVAISDSDSGGARFEVTGINSLTQE